MSLRRSPTRTPAFLAANRANALKSTGPRTAAGKARVALNPVRKGERAFRLRQNLLASGARDQAALYDWVLNALCRAFGIPRLPDGRPDFGTEELAAQAERLARSIFVSYQRALAAWRQAKPESPFDSRAFANAIRFHFRVRNPERTRTVNFWLLPGRGPNYFRRRGALPRRPNPPAVSLRSMRASPADPLLHAGNILASLGTAEHRRLWAGCRILPPTPRVTIHGWVEVARPARRPGRPRSVRDGTARGTPSVPPSLDSLLSEMGNLPPLDPSGRPTLRRPRRFLPAKVRGSPARESQGRPPLLAPVRRFLAGIVGAVSGWLGAPSQTTGPGVRTRSNPERARP